MKRRTTARETLGFRHDWVRCRDGKYECDCLIKVAARRDGLCPDKVQAALDDLNDAETELAAKDRELAAMRDGIKRFLVPWGPHLPPDWREHLESLIGEQVHAGLRDALNPGGSDG